MKIISMIAKAFMRERKKVHKDGIEHEIPAQHPKEDEPTIIGECSNGDFAGVNALYMAGLQNSKYKWVEARGKKGEAGTLQIIAHTTANPGLVGVWNGAT